MTLRYALKAFLALALVACGSDDSSSPLSGSPDGGAECTGTLEQVNAVFPSGGTCPTTYDAALAIGPICQGYSPTVRLGEVENELAYEVNWGTHMTQCFYDKNTRALIGAVACDDIARFCSDSSASIRYGEVVNPCQWVQNPSQTLNCPSDAGTDGSD